MRSPSFILLAAIPDPQGSWGRPLVVGWAAGRARGAANSSIQVPGVQGQRCRVPPINPNRPMRRCRRRPHALACKPAPEPQIASRHRVVRTAAAMQLAATPSRGATVAQRSAPPAAPSYSAARIAGPAAQRQRQLGGSSLLPPPPPAAAAAAALRSRQRAPRCEAAAGSDVIDVEGKVIDDRVPVTVRGARERAGGGRAARTGAAAGGYHPRAWPWRGHRAALAQPALAVDCSSVLRSQALLFLHGTELMLAACEARHLAAPARTPVLTHPAPAPHGGSRAARLLTSALKNLHSFYHTFPPLSRSSRGSWAPARPRC